MRSHTSHIPLIFKGKKNALRTQGYGVPKHLTCLQQRGPCAAHRRSFQPVRGMSGWTREAQLAQEMAEAAEEAAQLRVEAAVAAGGGGVGFVEGGGDGDEGAALAPALELELCAA